MDKTQQITASLEESLAWWQKALLPLSRLYGAAAQTRRSLYASGRRPAQRLFCPVISVGNMTAGGTGKTPMTVYLARRLKDRGISPLIVSRGYRGSASRAGGIVSDGSRILMDAGQAGDEPYMMARLLPDVPVAIGRRRFDIAMAAIDQFSPDVIVLDDGFQHFQLIRDLDIVLLDHARPLDNTHLLPVGMLREPVDCLKHADAVVFTRSDKPVAGPYPPELKSLLVEKPVFKARHRPYLIGLVDSGRPFNADADLGSTLPDHERVFVFSGLAKNNAFLDSVETLTDRVVGHAFFADHHFYSSEDLTGLAAQAGYLEADLVVTTQKDYVKIAGRPGFTQPLAVLGAKMVFDEEAAEKLDGLIMSCLNETR